MVADSQYKLPKNPITRFAPSPTGYLHFGHVISMAYVFGVASITNSRVLLRMEDHDTERSRKEYERAILDDMAWLGFIPDNWEEFMQRKKTKFRQSDQFDVYGKACGKLAAQGKLYACLCSRRQLEESDGTERPYPGTCRNKGIPIDNQSGCRFIVEDTVESFVDLHYGSLAQKPLEQCGDFLVRDRRGCFTYNLAVVADDIDQGVNFIIRGSDLLHCTGRQLVLTRALGGTCGHIYLHHPLAMGSDGKKLSKRTFSEGIIHRRQSGDRPQDIIGEALWMAGVIPKKMSIHAGEISKLMLDLPFFRSATEALHI